MSRFRWRLFWALAILNMVAVAAVLVITSNWPAAGSESPSTASPANRDPVVELAPTTVASAVATVTGPTAESQPSSTAIGGALVLWHSWAGGDGEALAAILTRFQQERPNIRVETHFAAYGELAQTYTDAVKAGGGPDLILAPNWWLRDLAEEGVVLPLESRITPQERAQFIPAAIDNLTWEGVLYGLPTNFEIVALYYNKRLLDEEQLPRAVDDLIDLALASPSQGVGIYTNFYHLFWGIPAFGGRLFDEDGRVVLGQTAGTADFLDWLVRAKDTPGIFVALDYGMLMDRFKKEEYALFIDGPWSMGELREQFGTDLGVAPLPGGPAGSARPWLGADGLFLNPVAAANRQELALELARYITNAESASTLARIAGRLPAHKEADLGDNALLAGFMQQGETALPQPHHEEMDEVWGYAGEMIAQALSGAATPEEAVLEAATLINEANGK